MRFVQKTKFFCFGFLCLLSFELRAVPCGSELDPSAGPFSLNSNWSFRTGDNLDWKDFPSEDGIWSKREIPDYGISKTENFSGLHWYLCTFVLPPDFRGKVEPDPLAIQLGRLRDADELYLNGKLIGKTGSFDSKPEFNFQKIRIYSLPSQLLQSGENTLAVRVFAVTGLHGMKDTPVIFHDKYLREKVFKEEIGAIVCGYVFLFMGIYFIVGSIVKGRAHENFFFAFFCIFIGFYVLLRTQHRDILFSNFSLSYTTELLILVSLPVLFLNFFYSYLKVPRSGLLFFYEVYLGVLFLITLFFRTPKSWFLIIELFNYALPVAFGLIVSIFYKYGKSEIKRLRFILIGVLLLLPTIVIDSLAALEIIHFPGTLYFGFLLFLFMISLQLSEDMVVGLQNYLQQEKELIQMEKIKTGFLVNISLEFRSGMDKIYLAIDKISRNRTKSGTALVESIRVAEEHISYMNYMVKEAILLKQLEEGSYSPKLENFELKKLILDCVHSVETHLGQSRKKKSVFVEPPNLEIVEDKELLFAILRNLVENAYIYTASDKEVKIECNSKEEYYTLVVSDDGMGMNQIEMETIFQKFVRGYSDSKNEIPGAGIGLTLVNSIVHFLKGEIHLKTQEGLGAQFSIKLPKRKGEL